MKNIDVLDFIVLLPACLGAAAFQSCSKEGEEQKTEAVLLTREDWAPDVKQGLNDFMTAYANVYDAYVVSDFDNTASIFDIEEQLAIYQLETMSFEMDARTLKKAISTGLEEVSEAQDWISDIVAAYDTLDGKWGPFTAGGVKESELEALHGDRWWQEFSTKMRAMYDKVGEWFSTDDSYCWILNWFTGMTPSQVYDLAYASHSKYSKVNTSLETWTSPSEIDSKLGQVSVEWTCGIAVSENIKELWKALYENNIGLWICSSSGVEQVKAAVDVFGLHNYVTGIIAMTMATDDEGRYLPEYDFSGKAVIPNGPGWTVTSTCAGTRPAGSGKRVAVLNAIAPFYSGRHPLAGFMDSTGDLNFCTEFSSLKIVVCFNRADRKITDGGALIAEVAMYEKETLRYDFAYAGSLGETLYVLQGRDENAQRSFRASNKTLKLGSSEEKLFLGQENYDQLEEMKTKRWSVKDAINLNTIEYITKDFKGYHSL